MDRSRDKFVSNLTNSTFTETERFKSDFREEMHAHIDDDIENEKCKEIFENERKQRAEKLCENIKKRFEKDEQQFREDIKKILNNLKKGLKII